MLLEPIAHDVFQISLMPRNSINCYIIEGVLVDLGIQNSYAAISRVFKQIPVYQHVLTHAHADHQGSSRVQWFNLYRVLYSLDLSS